MPSWSSTCRPFSASARWIAGWPTGCSIRAGSTALDPEVVRQLVSGTSHTDPLGGLSQRERDVLQEMAQGHTNAAIGQRLHVSQSAVEKHINAIFDKLDLARDAGYSRRVLAILRYLASEPVPPVEPGVTRPDS